MTDQQNKVVAEFTRYFATITEEAERARLLAKVKMQAFDVAPDEAFEPDVRTLREYLDTPIEIPPSLVWPTIAVRGEITTTLGRAGKGKTTMNLNRIFAWACRAPLFPAGRTTTATSTSSRTAAEDLIAENEGNAGMFHQKVGILLSQGPLTDERAGDVQGQPLGPRRRRLLRAQARQRRGCGKLRAAVEKCRAGHRVHRAVPVAVARRGELRYRHGGRRGQHGRHGDRLQVRDHPLPPRAQERRWGGRREDERRRGSTVLEGVVAVMENFESVKDGEYREMTWSKARYLPPPDAGSHGVEPGHGLVRLDSSVAD
jgi:hypothetical protein